MKPTRNLRPAIRSQGSRRAVAQCGLTVLVVMLAVPFLDCTAHEGPSKAETALANMAKDVVIPLEAEQKKNPLPDNDEIVKQGQQIFLQSCALCHGSDGRGAH